MYMCQLLSLSFGVCGHKEVVNYINCHFRCNSCRKRRKYELHLYVFINMIYQSHRSHDGAVVNHKEDIKVDSNETSIKVNQARYNCMHIAQPRYHYLLGSHGWGHKEVTTPANMGPIGCPRYQPHIDIDIEWRGYRYRYTGSCAKYYPCHNTYQYSDIYIQYCLLCEI